MNRKPLTVAAKVLVSAALIAFLARRWGGNDDFREALARLEWTSFAAAGAAIGAGLVLSAARWRLLLAARGVALGRVAAIRLYFVGYFFNLFLPTAVGGDVVRAIGIPGTPVSVVAGTILTERILGFGCLLALGLGASLASPSLAIVRPALGIATAVYAAGLLVLMRLPLHWMERPGVWNRLRGVARTALQVRGTPIPRATLAAALALSLAWQLALVLANGFLSLGLGGVAPWSGLLALVPVIQAIGMLPVSFGGLGVRELGYEYFFRRAGYEPAGAVALAACFLGVTLGVALIGGLLYLAFPLRARD